MDLIGLLEEGLRVLRVRDRLEIPDAMISERARDIAAELLGTFDLRVVREFPEDASWRTPPGTRGTGGEASAVSKIR